MRQPATGAHFSYKPLRRLPNLTRTAEPAEVAQTVQFDPSRTFAMP